MKTLALILLTAVVAVPVTASAQCDCSSMGLYFDPGAETFCLDFLPADSVVTLYLVYAFPIVEEIYGFEAGITVEGGGLELVSSDNLFGINTGPLNLANIRIECESPRQLSEFTVLLSLDFMNTSDGWQPCRFFLHSAGSAKGAFDRPRLLLGGDEYYETPVYEISPETGLCCVIAGDVNGCAPVPVDHTTWDQVKTLYR